jgi:molybdenum cofactor synthesis domain-containing protein
VLDINAEIITLGRELLIGRTINTNGSWIANQLTAIGIIVTRICVAGDKVNEISSAIVESLERKPSILITTGGLGPTYDDKTVEGLSAALNLPKDINNEALQLVKAKYAMMKLEMTSSRYKLAMMPIGGCPIVNEYGSAPGIFIEYRGTLIFSLPGVPREMMTMFMSQILKLIQNRVPSMVFRERSFTIEGIPESSLAPIIDEWIPSNRRIYLKSHPGGIESKPFIKIHLSAVGNDTLELDNILLNSERSFSRFILKAGGKIRRQKS